MLIIGHRGAAGLAPENTIAAMRAGVKAGVDMLEFDVRLTRDGVPVVIHDSSLLRTHHQRLTVGRTTLAELQAKTITHPIPTLAEVLDEFFGKIKLNIECKSRGSGPAVIKLAKLYVKQPKDWDELLFSSFHLSELRQIRAASPYAQLGLIHMRNPFTFVAHFNELQLSAVGFYKLTVNPLALAIAKKRGLFTYAYTINRLTTAKILKSEGIDGIVTNYPDHFRQ